MIYRRIVAIRERLVAKAKLLNVINANSKHNYTSYSYIDARSWHKIRSIRIKNNR